MQSTREFVALELQQFQSSVDAMRVRYDRFPSACRSKLTRFVTPLVASVPIRT